MRVAADISCISNCRSVSPGWKRLNLLYILFSGWQMSSVNKRTLSPSCAVNRICWSRLAAPCLSAEDEPRCGAPRTRLSFDKDKKLRRECGFHKTWPLSHRVWVERRVDAHRLRWGGFRLTANDTNTRLFFFQAEVCSSAALTEPWEFCMSCFRVPSVERKLLQGHIHSIKAWPWHPWRTSKDRQFFQLF